MAQHNNIWIQVNNKNISSIKRQLVEYSYAGSYGGKIPLMQINSIIDGALLEIKKLQSENDELKVLIREAMATKQKEEPAEKKEAVENAG